MRTPEEARRRRNIELKKLSNSLFVEYTDRESQSAERNSPRRKDARQDGRETSVAIVVHCVAVLVSSETMIFEGSSVLLGTGDKRIASKGDCGVETGTPPGPAGAEEK